MALTDTAIRAVKPKAKPYKLPDERGLFLLVAPSGGMLWRLKYRANGVDENGQPKRIEKLLALGSYPAVSLKQARARLDEARERQATGVDPAELKQREKNAAKASAVNTFNAVALKCIEKNEREGLAAATLAKRHWFLKLLRPALGNRPVADIQPSPFSKRCVRWKPVDGWRRLDGLWNSLDRFSDMPLPISWRPLTRRETCAAH